MTRTASATMSHPLRGDVPVAAALESPAEPAGLLQDFAGVLLLQPVDGAFVPALGVEALGLRRDAEADAFVRRARDGVLRFGGHVPAEGVEGLLQELPVARLQRERTQLDLITGNFYTPSFRLGMRVRCPLPV